MEPVLLYIDPGTGSMLFSIFIGAAATLFFLAKAALIRLKVFFGGKKSGVDLDPSYKKYIVYCEDKRYWTVFKPVADAFENRGVELHWLTSCKDDPVFAAGYKFVRAEFIGEGNAAFARLNLLSGGILLTTTPGLDVYQWKRSRNVRHYSYILHGAGDPTMMHLFALDSFDSVLLTGGYQIRDIRYLEKKRGAKEKELCTIGCTYLDELYKKNQEQLSCAEKKAFTVLVSPSWGADSLLSKFGERLLDPLEKTGWKIIIRPHPQSKISEREVLDRLQERYKGCANVEWDFNRDNFFSMQQADIMISDYSSIIFDYTFVFDRPVIYANSTMNIKPYDAYDLPGRGKDIWQFRALKEFGLEIDEEKFGDIKNVIQNASDSKELSLARDRAKKEAWENIGRAGRAAMEFMVKKMEESNA